MRVLEGRRIELRGTVQGVGMRPWIYRVAHEQGVSGRVWNDTRGVTIDAFGSPEMLDAFVCALMHDQPAAARTESIATAPIPPEPADNFVIVESRPDGGHNISIPADLPTCPECAAEIFDCRNRRYRYPFTNCTNCGPRFTIATDIPYDRPCTTMAPFVMCPSCQREYDDPANRRFHAQPNACPACGPQITALWPNGDVIDVVDPIAYAARAIAGGSIIAVKGIGGFHLACDASSSVALTRLRERKRREEKPFAVMVSNLAAARQLAVLGPQDEALLESAERPIVLLPRLEGARLAPEVGPRNPLVGLMLPYTPLHHLLLADAAVPLVMTSANHAEEPIVYRNAEAVACLGQIADFLLVHNREIVTRCDDSVAMTIAGAPMLLRRSRGFVPRAIALREPIGVPVLACGALLKNTFCIAHGEHAWLGPHVGNLENADAFDAYQDAIASMERFVGIRGEVIAHDLHPDYLSTRYASERSASTVAVQHHHAHVASAIAEHGLASPVIGVAFDGTGYGTDGTSWGGEFFVGDCEAVKRVATFRALHLAGGDRAVREPWRVALALVLDAMGDGVPLGDFDLFREIDESQWHGVQEMLARGINTPAARGVGRYFDAVGALVLKRPHAAYEGQVAFELNMAADPTEPRGYEYAIDRTPDVPEIDLRPAMRALVCDVLNRVPPATISARFHNTLVNVTAVMVRHAARALGDGRRAPVVLTGGCFQNAWLAEGVRAALAIEHETYLHRRVPPGDGGIALGQALVAAARTRG